MLDIKIASDDPQSMSQDGASILRSLQNKSLSMVDLVVRESIQNSLDATNDGEQYTQVDFKIDTFDTKRLSSEFSQLEQVLQSRYSHNNQYLAISDKFTSGLTGDFKGSTGKDLSNSNFFKLVFGIGKNQENDGAGGSWGLGKTSYFRIGIGLVIYYTRIELSSGEYQERLIASLIEDNKKDDRLLPSSDRGIAWWGEKEGSDYILPVTDSETIKDFLSIFGLKQYSGSDTGTTIIVPYLSENFTYKKYAPNSVESNCYWLTNLSSEIEMAVQRWYFPRITNKVYRSHFKKSMLFCSVNGNFIIDIKLSKTFSILQQLYNSALLGNSVESSIITKPILLKRIGAEDRSKPIGYVAFREVSKDDAKMTPPNNSQSPLAYLNNFDDKAITDHNGKFLGYCRKPGMIVEYDFDNNWLPGGELQKENQMLFAMFVPVSDLKLDSNHYASYPTVESYLRSVENADHASWVDESKLTFIKRTKKNVTEAVKANFLSDVDSQMGNATSRLSKMLGKAILPPTGFGKKSSEEKDEAPKHTRQSSSKASITIDEVNVLDSSFVELKVSCRIPKDKECRIKIQVETQENSLDKEKWEAAFPNISFPFNICSVKSVTENLINGRDFKIVDGEVVFEKVYEGKSFELFLKIEKNTNHYAPTIVINS